MASEESVTQAQQHEMRALGARAVSASRQLAKASTAAKNSALAGAADLLQAESEEILAANETDVAAAQKAGTSATVVDRLRLTPGRIDSMAAGLRQIAGLPDPVGETLSGWRRPNGLEIRQVRVPLGVIGIIYENRPNVTADAAGLCLKSGNAALLRGSSAAIHSNRAIAAALRQAISKAGLPEDAVGLVDDTSRAGAVAFMQLRGVVDCLIPRGGKSLIDSVLANATVPYVIDGDGNCHVYVDRTADLDMATSIVVNGKTQRPSVCNATESLIVDRAIAGDFLPRLAAEIPKVALVGDDHARQLLGPERVRRATHEDYSTEFLDLQMSVATVNGLDEAIAHITEHGSGHTEVIVTSDVSHARRFQQEVDAAAVVVNASSRFTDGEEYGFGAEIGISTQKLHARGPMGLRELTTTKYLVDGTGQIR